MNKILIIILLILSQDLYSQLNIQVSAFNKDQQPFFEILVRAREGVSNIELSVNDVVIKENNRTVLPLSIGSPDGQGFQLLRWIPYYDNIQARLYSGEIVVSKSGISGSVQLSDDNTVTPLISVIGDDDIQVRNITFGNDRIKQLKITQLRGKETSEGNIPYPIDSITTRTDNFSVAYGDLTIGGSSQKVTPPFDMPFGSSYSIIIYFNPDGFTPHSDVLTIYYNGGAKKEINLFGYPLVVRHDPVLEITQPSGTAIYSPCEDVEIKWVGTTLNIPTLIDVSFDGGMNWQQVDRVVGNSYTYTIPNQESENFQFRVRQEFNRTQSRNLPVDQDIQKITYSIDGSQLASISSFGKVQIWNLSNTSLIKEFTPSGITSAIECTGLYYLSDTEIGFTFYRLDNDGNRTGLDNFRVFDISSDPQELINQNFNLFPVIHSEYEMATSTVYILGDDQTVLAMLNSETGLLKNQLNFDSPLSAINVNDTLNQIVVAELTGNISVLRTSDFGIEYNYQFDMVPNIIKLSLADNGQFLTLGTKKFEGDGSAAQIFIMNLFDGQIFQFIEAAASDPKGISFSPKSTMMVIGSEFNPRIFIWDLVRRTQAAGFGDVIGPITDVTFSPVEQSLAFSTKSPGEIVYTSFTYPEFDVSDSLLRIVKPIIELQPLNFDSTLIYSDHSQTFTTEICNIGESKYFINNRWWRSQEHFDWGDNPWPDTIQPGECLRINLIFNPKDTGFVSDTLILSNRCDQNEVVILQGYGLDRNLNFFYDPLDFGEVCVGDTIILDTLIFENQDTIPITINEIRPAEDYDNILQVIEFARDTVVPPSGTFSAIVSAVPDTLGDIEGIFEIIYLYQFKYKKELKTLVKGIGTYIQPSHIALPFIEEEPIRVISINNPSNTDILINNILVEPPGAYEVLTEMPLAIPEGGSVQIEVSWDSTDQDANLVFEADPCPTVRYIPLAKYKGTSYLEIPEVFADDPLAEVEIPIYFNNNFNFPYNGNRKFNAEINLAKNIFFPTDIRSNYQATFINNGYLNDRRSITIDVVGNYTPSDTIAVLKGVVGLTDRDTSRISFNEDSYFWGSQVSNVFVDGDLIINGICGERLLLENGNEFLIDNIYPNPSVNSVNIDIKSSSSLKVQINIIDQNGVKIISKPHWLIIGDNRISLNVNSLVRGQYILEIRYDDNVRVSGSLIKQ